MAEATERIGVTCAGSSPGPCAPDEIERAPSPEPTVLGVFVRLMEGFAHARIAWCYWKSSRRAAEALAGLTDLDILVARASQHDARRVLLECGFRPFVPVAIADVSVECYLNYDEPSGRIAHVDLHVRLTVGGALLKTHWLPWEERLIERATFRADLDLPQLDPLSEAVLLVVRSSLELRWYDLITPRNRALKVKKFTLDRMLLASHVEPEALRSRAAELLGPAVAASVAEVLFDPRPLRKQRRLRRRIRHALVHFRTWGGGEGLIRTLWRGSCVAMHRLNRRKLHWPRPWNRRAAGGGMVVAVIGVDGAGKSTLVRGLRGWLEGEVDVLPLYFGTGDGPASWFLAPVKRLVPLVSRLLRRKSAGSSHGLPTPRAPGIAYGLSLAIWALLVAFEKRTKLRAAHRAASRGMVVIADRYPQNESPDFNDGPLLPRLKRVPQWLRTFERAAYTRAQERRPDVAIKLVASPELIAVREPTMDPDLIRARTTALGPLSLGCAQVTAITASQPAVEVLQAAKRVIWRSL